MLMVSRGRCQHCSQEMRAARQFGRRRRFCSNACRQAEFRNNHPNPNSGPQPQPALRNAAPPTDVESRLAHYRAQIPSDLSIPKFTLRIGKP